MFFDTFFTKRLSSISRNELIELLESCNYDTAKAAKKLKCSRDKIIWWATKHLVRIPRNTYKHNINVFSVFNEESAYWAGLLSADGCIKKHLVYDYLLELTSDDQELVVGFKKFIQSNKPIDKRKRDNGKM